MDDRAHAGCVSLLRGSYRLRPPGRRHAARVRQGRSRRRPPAGAAHALRSRHRVRGGMAHVERPCAAPRRSTVALHVDHLSVRRAGPANRDRTSLIRWRHGRLPAHHGSDHRPRAEPRLLRGAGLSLLPRHGHRQKRRARGDELLLLARRRRERPRADLQPRRPHLRAGHRVRAHRDRRRRPRRHPRGAEGRHGISPSGRRTRSRKAARASASSGIRTATGSSSSSGASSDAVADETVTLAYTEWTLVELEGAPVAVGPDEQPRASSSTSRSRASRAQAASTGSWGTFVLSEDELRLDGSQRR